MEQEIVQVEEATNMSSVTERDIVSIVVRIVLAVISLALVITGLVIINYGFYTMYTYGDGTVDMTGHIVGGDAYNFIIIGIRGLGWIVSGAAAFIGGSVIAGVAILFNRKIKKII